MQHSSIKVIVKQKYKSIPSVSAEVYSDTKFPILVNILYMSVIRTPNYSLFPIQVLHKSYQIYGWWMMIF